MLRLTRNRIYSLQLFSALAGAVVSVYLLVQHTLLKSGIQGTSSFCSFGKYADCDVVNASAYSEVFGIPLATLGALFYGVLLALAVLSPPPHSSFSRSQRYLAFVALAGLGVDLILLGVQVFVLNNFCVLCFVTYVATLGVLYSAMALADSSAATWLGRLRAVVTSRKKAAAAPVPNKIAATATLVAIGAIALLLPSRIVLRSASHQQIDQSIERFIEEFKGARRKPIDVKPGDGTFGNSASRIRIVAFSDFECPHCQQAAFTLQTALQPLRDRIFFVFKHFPLDPSCNRLVKYQLHENACRLARLSYCATGKQKFWEFHDRVFEKAASGTRVAWDRYVEHVAPVFSQNEIDRCLADPASLRNVQADIALGDSLEIRGTPTIFFNGKVVTIPLTVEMIRRLIEIESAS